jgi:hypothetical protein
MRTAVRLTVPTTAAVRDYLIGKGVDGRVSAAKASNIAVPLTFTKCGAVVFGPPDLIDHGAPARHTAGDRIQPCVE